MVILSRIKELAKQQHISISGINSEYGEEAGYLNKVAAGRRTISQERLEIIAKLLHTTVAYITGESDSPNDDSVPSKLHKEKGEKVAVYSTVGAGIPMEAINTFDQDDPDSWEEISRIDASRGEYFALRVRGNSMEPLIRHGDIVIVRKQDEYNDGDIVIALVNGNEGVCKILEYRNNGGIALLSINPDYPPMTYSAEQIENLPVRIMGRCVERRGRL